VSETSAQNHLHSNKRGELPVMRNLIKFLSLGLLCSLPVAGAWADGAVYAMTNALGNNEVNVYHRAADGNLSLVQTAATGGGGSGLQLVRATIENRAFSKKHAGNPMKSPGKTIFKTCRRPSCETR
jgi:hypothetical protein